MAKLGSLDPSAVEVLRKLVDQFEGKAELLYAKGEWMFLVRGSGEGTLMGAPGLNAGEYDASISVHTKGFDEDEVGEAGKRALGIAGNP